MEIAIGIIGILVAILLYVIPEYRRKHNERPNLDLEIIYDGSTSSELRLSDKNNPYLNPLLVIDGNQAIRIYRLEFRAKLILRNNSNYTAYYPEIKIVGKTKFTRIDKLNLLKPINNNDEIILAATFTKEEECKGSERTQIQGFPQEFDALQIHISFKNHYGKKFVKNFDYSNKEFQNRFIES
jgi:hypothetical protein